MSQINRTCHVLKKEKTLAVPRHVIFCDTETKFFTLPNGDTQHELELGWACYYRRGEGRRSEKQDWQFFTTQKCLWDFILDYVGNKNRLWVITHNLSFDFTILNGWRHLRKAGFKIKFFYSNGITTIIKVKAKGKSILFVDSLNWFKESLEQIGERLNVPKLKIDFETASKSEKKIYCRRDVEILLETFKALTRYLQGNHISRLCYTIGSTAMAAYLFRHYDYLIYIHNNAEAIDLERESYRGGRTECFYIGELNHGPYYIVDVNSLYPCVMRNNFYPVKYVKMYHDVSLSLLSDLLKSHSIIAKVWIQTNEAIYALKQKRTIFPVGSFWITLTTPELKQAIVNGHIKHIETTVVYEQAPIFKTFVNRFYELRNDFKSAGVPMFEHFTKILMNSLYGKFGQKAENWIKIGDCKDEPDRVEDVLDVVTGRRRRLRYLLGEIFEMVGHEESRHSFPAISSHVTAYGRMYLWDLMKQAGEGNYYYCDTDSLFVNQQGLDNLNSLIDNTRIGALKIENTTDNIIIYGLKDYTMSGKTVIKGVKKKAVKIADMTYRQENWPSFNGLLRDNHPDTYTTHPMIKTLSREYTKGIVNQNGTVVPLRLAELAL